MRIFLFFIFFTLGASQTVSASTEITRFHISDKLSQSSILLDESGDIVAKERISTFGSLISSNREAATWQSSYHGKFRDSDNGLINFGARLYDPEIGRFITIDPRGFRVGAPESFNRYAFSNNNPYRYTDPDGRVVETVWDFANVGIGAHSLMTNLVNGNWSAAAEDAVGLGLDGLAAAIPFVPGGASSAIKMNRSVSSAGNRGANNAASGENLNKQLAAQEIANGHAFEKHVLKQGEFPGIRTRQQFQNHIEDVISNPSGVRYYKDGRTVHLQESSGTVVFRNPGKGESTAFQPSDWSGYVDTLPSRLTPFQ